MDGRGRAAVDFELGMLERMCRVRVELPFGVGLLAPEFGPIWDLNLVAVRDGAEPDPAEVLAAADEVLGGADLGHRTVRWLAGGDVMDEVEGAFRAAGYDRDSWVVLAWEGQAPVGPSEARVLEPAEFDDLNLRLNRARPWGADEAKVELFGRFGRRQLEVGPGVAVGAFDDGLPVGAARVFGDGPVRQIEEMEVLASARGRGHGAAILARAVQVASADDPAMVFLVAEEDDWPRGWYERFGFVPVARSGQFQRRPSDAD